MPQDRLPTVRISLYWDDRVKGWELIATGAAGRREWRVRRRSLSHAELDSTATMMLLRALTDCMESLLY